MATVERCQLSDLPVDQCACRLHPKGKAYDARQARIDINPGAAGYSEPVAARFPGVCPECGDPFAPGEAIRARSYGGSGNTPFRRWIHAHCTE